MKKKIILFVMSVITTLTCAAALTACGGGGGSTNSGDESSTNKKDPEQIEDTQPPEDENTDDNEQEEHKLIPISEVPATCTTDGNIAYYTCEICNNYFSDDNAQTEIKNHNSVILPATGHNMTPHTAVAATCISEGNVAYYSCSYCNKNYDTEAGTTVLTTVKTNIDSTNHENAMDAAAVPSTCTIKGNIAFSFCYDCNKYFDTATKQQISQFDIITDFAPHTLSSVNAKPATCDDSGNSAYSVCSVCEKWFDTDNEVISDHDSVVLSALGHNYGEWTQVTAPSCSAFGEEQRVCTRNSQHIETQQIAKTSHDYDNAVCSVCGEDQPTSQGLNYTLNDDGESYAVSGTSYLFGQKSIVIPATYQDKPVTVVNSFPYNRETMTSIKLPDTITTIGSSAFSGCSKLKNITLPDNVTTIGNYAFSACTSLEQITIPKNVTTIDSGAFYRCTGLTDIIIPNNVTTIGSSAFYGCTALKNVTVGTGVTSLGNYAFQNCDNIEKVRIIDLAKWCTISFASDYSSPLFYTKELYLEDSETPTTNLVIPDDVTSISSYAFRSCKFLTSITIPESVTTIGDCAFLYCINIEQINFNAEEITNTCSMSERSAFINVGMLVPETKLVVGNKVKSIPSCLFTYSDINSVEFEADSVCKSLEPGAFYGCYTLSNITIPASMTTIYANVFGSCTGLTSITIPSTITLINDNAFSNCANLFEVINLSEVETKTEKDGNLGYYAKDIYTSIPTVSNLKQTADGFIFYNNGESRILINYVGTKTRITLPNYSLGYTINDYALNGIGYITDVDVPYGTSFGRYVFANCDNLTSVNISAPITSIPNATFYNCYNLTDITLPKTITAIGQNAFTYCSALKEISIPANVTSINDSFGHTNIESVYITDITKWCEISFYTNNITNSNPLSNGAQLYLNDKLVTEVDIKDITKIKSYVFYNYSSLESITIDDNVTSIGSSAFSGTGYYKNDDNWEDGVLYIGNHLVDTNSNVLSGNYTIKEGTLTIANYAFYYCANLTGVTIPSTITKIDNYTFYYCGLESVVIPEGITYIGYRAFGSCNSLTEITIPSTVTYIDLFAFSGDSNVATINYNAAQTELAELTDGYATIFGNIGSSVTDGAKLVIGSTVKTIPASIFASAKNIKTVEFKTNENAITIGTDTFYNFGSDTNVYVEDLAMWLSMKFESNTATPFANGGNLYINNELLDNFVTPDDITTISDYAFYGCTSLLSITITDNVESIGNSSFKSCTNAATLTIGKGVTSINVAAFDYLTGLTQFNYNATECQPLTRYSTSFYEAGYKTDNGLKLVIGSNVKALPDYFFYSTLAKITSIEFGENSACTSIGNNAFLDTLTYLEYVYYDIPALDNFTSSYSPFRNIGSKSGLNIVIGPNVTKIPSYLFYGNYGYTGYDVYESITFVEDCSVTTIEANAFCIKGVNKVYVEDINDWYKITFASYSTNPVCLSGNLYDKNGEPITSLTVPEGTTAINAYAFYGYKTLESITIPNSVTSIGTYAFNYCTSLTEIIIPDEVTTLEEDAFFKCTSLQKVTLSANISAINRYAFAYCSALTEIVFKGTVEQWRAITKNQEWNYVAGNYVVICSDGKIAKDGTLITEEE
jgi:hypothetical protein